MMEERTENIRGVIMMGDLSSSIGVNTILEALVIILIIASFFFLIFLTKKLKDRLKHRKDEYEYMAHNDWDKSIFGVPIRSPGSIKFISVINAIFAIISIFVSPILLVLLLYSGSLWDLFGEIRQIMLTLIVSIFVFLILGIVHFISAIKINNYSPSSRIILTIISLVNIFLFFRFIIPPIIGIATIMTLYMIRSNNKLYRRKSAKLKKYSKKRLKEMKRGLNRGMQVSSNKYIESTAAFLKHNVIEKEGYYEY
ncbi:MAG: hypothetical protein R6V01_03065 [Thermoplasmatota archaeon]